MSSTLLRFQLSSFSTMSIHFLISCLGDFLLSVPISFKGYDKTITLLELRSVKAGTS